MSVAHVAVIFDWDDTLLSSSWLASHNLGLDTAVIPNHVRVELEALQHVVHSLLTKALLHSDSVHVVTNAEAGWVTLSCRRFMPRIEPLLSKLTSIVSARTRYEKFAPDDPSAWKRFAFSERLDAVLFGPGGFLDTVSEHRQRCNTIDSSVRFDVPTSLEKKSTIESGPSSLDSTAPSSPITDALEVLKTAHVVSVGDSMHERRAVFHASTRASKRNSSRRMNSKACFDQLFTKSVKLCENPSNRAMTRQLDLIQDALERIVTHQGDLDLVLEANADASAGR